MAKLLVKLLRNESGATAIEYGLVVGLIALVAIVAIKQLGNNVAHTLNEAADNMNH